MKVKLLKRLKRRFHWEYIPNGVVIWDKKYKRRVTECPRYGPLPKNPIVRAVQNMMAVLPPIHYGELDAKRRLRRDRRKEIKDFTMAFKRK